MSAEVGPESTNFGPESPQFGPESLSQLCGQMSAESPWPRSSANTLGATHPRGVLPWTEVFPGRIREAIHRICSEGHPNRPRCRKHRPNVADLETFMGQLRRLQLAPGGGGRVPPQGRSSSTAQRRTKLCSPGDLSLPAPAAGSSAITARSSAPGAPATPAAWAAAAAASRRRPPRTRRGDGGALRARAPPLRARVARPRAGAYEANLLRGSVPPSPGSVHLGSDRGGGAPSILFEAAMARWPLAEQEEWRAVHVALPPNWREAAQNRALWSAETEMAAEVARSAILGDDEMLEWAAHYP